jgi:hypothetical protein
VNTVLNAITAIAAPSGMPIQLVRAPYLCRAAAPPVYP